jgi:hypothetical protein
MEDDKSNEDPSKRSYVLQRMKRITASSERTVKWVLYLWIATIVATLLGVLWLFII